MKLSVIIPCLNGAATLAVQLEALSAQIWSNEWELIVSDNGSTDDSIAIANEYKNKFNEFRIVDASLKKGGSFAINKGVLEAASEYIAVCDADDEVVPGWVAAIGEALSNHDVVCGKFLFDKFNEPDEAVSAGKGWETGLYIGNFLPGGGSGNFGIKKSIHQSIGGFDECLPHAYDADYFWRLQLEGYKLHSEKNAIIQVRIGRVNPKLSYMFRRGKNRAASNYWCYKRYKQFGMQKPNPITKTYFEWYKLLRNGMRTSLKQRNNRFEWLPNFAQKTGNLAGEFQGRLTNPCKSFSPRKNH